MAGEYLKKLIEDREKQKKRSSSTKDIAPLPEDRTWFQKGALDDGYQFGDVTKTILSSGADISENITAGVLGIGERVVDAGAYLLGGAGNILGADEFAQQMQGFIQKDLYDEKAIAQSIILGNAEHSVFGEKSDALMQSAGQLGATIGLQAAGVPWWVTTGVTSFGGEVENAFNESASYGEAGLSAAISAGAEILTEKISGGISFGGKTLDDALTKSIARGVSNKVVRTLTKLGVDMVGEGAEEVLSGAMSAIGQKMTYADNKTLSELFSREDALESFIGGAVLGGGSGGIHAVRSTLKGRDYTSGLTANEEAVVNKLLKDRMAEEAKKEDGKSESEVYDEIMDALDNGEISIDTIEEVLGGDSYKAYKDTVEREKEVIAELEGLYEGEELKREIMDFMGKESKRGEAQTKLSSEVFELVKDSRLAESYYEVGRRRESFKADPSKYNEKQRRIVQKAIDSGVLNNTRRTHILVDTLARIAEDKDVDFDFATNQKLKESGFAVEGADVNGYVVGNNITINMNSRKAWEFTVGHEITHVLEGTELYDGLRKALESYARGRKSKGGKFDNEYMERLYKVRQLYKGKDGYQGVEGFNNIKKEVIADLVGDYIFNDTDFIRHLSTKHRNVFEKIYDEIKYLAKVVTAGSEEARQIEKIKKAFEDAYRAEKNTATDVKPQLSSTDSDGADNGVKVLAGGTVTKYSLSTWTPETQTKVRENLVKAGYEEDRVDKWIADTNGIASVIAADKDRLDFVATDNHTMLKNNQEYVKTLDASTLCAKRLTYQGTFDAIQHRLPNTVLSSDDLILLANMMKEHGVEAPCSVCYVESRRRHLGKFAQGWLDKYEGAYKPNLDEVTTSDGLEALRKSHPDTYEDFMTAMKKKGSANPKVVQLRTEYRNEIMALTPAQIRKIEAIGGLRVQSFSDFETPHLLDMMQAVMDMTAKGLSSQAYTKVPNFAWVFGDTGIKINLSLIADGNGFDADGNLVFSSIEGMNIDDAMKLRDAYSENVGTIIVGVNDKHILACMADDRIDFIIPFHRSGWGQKELEMMGMSSYSDYTYGQNEHSLETGEGVANLYPPDYWDYTLSGKENAERYLNLCARTGREPKFSQFLVNNGDGSYSLQPDGSTDGYWKTLIDFKMYDNEGNGAPQKKVQPNFNMEEAHRVLGEYKGGANSLPVATDVVEEFVSRYQNGTLYSANEDIAPVRYSLTDSDGKKLSPEQQEYFKDSKVRDENGNLMVVYHGTNQGSFTEFLWDKTQRADGGFYGRGHYFTSSNGMAEQYGSKVLRGYLNIKNPFVWEEEIGTYNGRKVSNIQARNISARINMAKVFPKLFANKLMKYGEFNNESGEMEEKSIKWSNLEEEITKTIDTLKPLVFSDGSVQWAYPGDLWDRNVGDRYASMEDAESHKFEAAVQAFVEKHNGIARDMTFDDQTSFVQDYGNEVSEALMSMGYDGAMQDRNGTEIVAFNSNQFKNADNLNPTEDPDIRYSLSDDDIAPIGDNAATTLPDDFAPVRSDIAPTEAERYAKDVERINKKFAADKAALDEEFAAKREQLADKDAFISGKAAELYKELRGLKKGVRASEALGYLLDHGYEWDSIRAALVNIRYTPDRLVNQNSTIEDIARKMLDDEYESSQYDLEEEYQERLEALETEAAKKRHEAKRITRKERYANIIDGFKKVFAEKGYDLDELLKNGKNLSTFETVDNTPQRVNEKTFGYKAGQILNDLTVNRVAQNETEGIKWLNTITGKKDGLLAQLSKEYGIKAGSKESAAAQMYAEGFYVDDNNDIIEYGDAELAADFPDASVQKRIKGLAGDARIRQFYDETLKAINESRTRNGYAEIPRLDNYFLHFRAMDDTFSRLGLPFNPNDIRAKDLPTDLNGVTADLKPGKPFFASEKHRMGKRTTHDILGGLERYATSAKNQIYHIDDIQNFRALRNYTADTFGQANGLSDLDAMSEEEAQQRIAEVFSSHLSNYAKFLNEEANILAGKTALIDRGLEGMLGRRAITFLKDVNKQVGANMVGFNVSSSLTNFLPVVQTFAKTNKADFVKAFSQTVANKLRRGKLDNFTENSPVMIRRKGADAFYRTPFQKVADAGYTLMSAVDDISTELIARTKFNELTRKGMDEQKAHYETDKWVSRLMGDRSLGQMPQLYNSKMLGLITKFQLEVRNQLDSQFYDTIQEAKVSNEDIADAQTRNAKTAAKVASTFVQLAVVQHLFGKAFEAVAGYNPAFDIIEVLMTTFGWDDDEDDEDTALDNIEEGFLALMEDLPYTSIFTGGRIPIASAMPIEQLIKGKDDYGNDKSRLETIAEVAPYYLLPAGYGQIKKTYQGLSMFDDDLPISGSYTDSGNLRFPVEETPLNVAQAALFGQWASENAREYFDGEHNTLKENQIQELVDVDIPIREYWDYREGLAEQNTLEEKFDYIAGLDLPVAKKNILINNVVDRDEKVDLSNYDDFANFEEFDFAIKNPTKYAVAKASGGYASYKKHMDELKKIEADKNANGKSISGSRKKKVLSYINSIDADYGEKLIIYKHEYPADDTYNREIIEYLNNRNDISYEEMMIILQELGFIVSADGRVSWD